ncbi:ROK family transcriptional regulator [Cryobacterium melibiosiphilum]|uniref:ROK family transcriptional regulator n=1 Tax=Cryobacterium melibiosiphilum TaxID=995039 RepID=A0A3A5MHQ6_9MICO|nr:ROK family transcriptional regulator [Cryobacterium melibiosiphilum]RJT89730.1 ROK family transcriptional regulator [Cryobacterium melibiosiphilum]
MSWNDAPSHVSDVLSLFRDRKRLSRTDVMRITGLSRSTVNQRLTSLHAAGLISAIGGGESTGGRPSSLFEFNQRRASLLAVDIGASGFIVALCDLEGTPIRHVTRRVNVWEGPERVLGDVLVAMEELGDTGGVWGIGVGVPGPVDFAAGRVVSPPIMTGWDGFDIAGWFGSHFAVPVVVENDANARAAIEARVLKSDNLIGLKLGTGIGAGLVFNGQIVRGNEGAAGDIGHTRTAPTVGPDEVALLQCRCGNEGCVEASASGWALVRDLTALGIAVTSPTEVVQLVIAGNIAAVRLVRQAGRTLGDAVADLVSILNPAVIVVSGQLADCGEVLMSGIRERVYQRTSTLATRRLRITTSTLGDLGGVSGLALITADQIFGTDAIDEQLRRVV